jgi:hypothetical protein
VSDDGDFLEELEQAAASAPSEDDWDALDTELDERLDLDETVPESWGEQLSLAPGERWRGYFRTLTPNPAEDRAEVPLLETLEREPAFMYGTKMLIGELEKAGTQPGDMIAIGRRLEDGKGKLGDYAYYRVRSRSVDDDIPI